MAEYFRKIVDHSALIVMLKNKESEKEKQKRMAPLPPHPGFSQLTVEAIGKCCWDCLPGAAQSL